MPDTIAAIATPAGRGSVGILRLSGPIAAEICGRIAGSVPAPRHAVLARFVDATGEPIDQGLTLYFPAPHSLTGEDVVELQGHGGPVVMGALLEAACAHGARRARPGEFSERAYLNGRIDLAQAEAIADLIDASSREAASAASRSLQGEFSARVNALRDDIGELRVYAESAIDFSEDDIDALSRDDLRGRLLRIAGNIDTLLASATQGRRLSEGMVVAIAGQPNVGKSTLLNRLAGTDAAIVTEIPGTTRDLLRENIVLDGLPVTVVDTAGLRESDDPVEREGVRRAWKMLEQAELILFVVDDRMDAAHADEALLRRLPAGTAILLVRNKCDLSRRPALRQQAEPVTVRVSAQTGEGLDLLTQEIKRIAGLATGTQGLFSARTRHVDALRRTSTHLRDAGRLAGDNATLDLVAEELRLAQGQLAQITGEVSTEELLGAIFSRFCIGK